jgi:hypothetical protein
MGEIAEDIEYRTETPRLRPADNGALVWSNAPTAEWLAEQASETALIMNVADRALLKAPEGVTPPLYTEAVSMFRGLLPYTGSMDAKTLGLLADIAYGTTDGRQTDHGQRGDQLVTMLVRSISEYGVHSHKMAGNEILTPIIQEFEMREAHARTDHDTPTPEAIALPIIDATPELVGWVTSYRYAKDKRDALGLLRPYHAAGDYDFQADRHLIRKLGAEARVALLEASLGRDITSGTTHDLSGRHLEQTTLDYIAFCRDLINGLDDQLFAAVEALAQGIPAERGMRLDSRNRALAHVVDRMLSPDLDWISDEHSHSRAVNAQLNLLEQPGNLGMWIERASSAQVSSLWANARKDVGRRSIGGAQVGYRQIDRLVEAYRSAFEETDAPNARLVESLARTSHFLDAVRDRRNSVSPLAPHITSLADRYLKNLPEGEHPGSRVEALMLLAGDAIDALHSPNPVHVSTQGLNEVVAAFAEHLSSKDLARSEKRRINKDPELTRARGLVVSTLSTRRRLGPAMKLTSDERTYGS